MTNPILITQEDIDGIKVFRFSGYFSESTGKELTRLLQPHLQNGIFAFVFDFSACPVINSPGLVALFTLATTITEDMQGKLVLVGLNELQAQVFRTISMHMVADFGRDVPDGIKLIRA